ncbi:MAG: BMP family ABC transporter substrate-binding protein [Deltaproteobacteria bacterium]|nr:BMP family ABC transporter substrate-binding protein [Deltaproteobacteria bacterium]
MKTEVLSAAVLLVVAQGCSLALNPEIPSTGSKVFGATCGAASECASGICEATRCSESCSAADPCPNGSGAACNAAGVCVFSTGATAYGGKCAAASECASGLCAESRCTATCNVTDGCEGENTECNASTNLCSFLSPPPITDPLKVGLLYVGPVGDHGWTLTHERGRQYFTSEISGTTSEFVPSVDQAAAPAKIDELIANGNNVVIGTSFDFLVPFLSRAPNNPDVNFLICSGFQTGPNLGSYFGRMYQVMYMMGVMAGRVTRNGRIGVVGPVAIPETVRHTNAFARGVRSVNPTAEIYIEWVEAWFNPPVEVAATEALLNQADVDIVFGFTDTIIPIQTAATASTAGGDPVYVIGYDNRDSCDIDATVKERCLTSAYWNWGPMVTQILQDMKAGRWRPDIAIWEQMKSSPEQSSVYFADLNTALVDTAVRVEVEGLIPSLTANTEEARMLPFSAPVKDASGATRLQVGQSFDDEDLLNMCWLVEGVYNVDGSPGTVPANCVGVR